MTIIYVHFMENNWTSTEAIKKIQKKARIEWNLKGKVSGNSPNNHYSKTFITGRNY